MNWNVKIDFDTPIGKIKPFHGINNAPIPLIFKNADLRLMNTLKEAGIPYSRLHDTGGPYGANRFVDIENIFRDWNADPEKPESYDFAFTDVLLEIITAQGTEPFFRLGTTIENDHEIRVYRIFPPKDNLKWAKICEGIIKHYNYGWANGYRYNIRYWEIWNEPDNGLPEENAMWKGTKEQYFALYETAANYLKKKFPEIKIGGYASCGFYALFDGMVIKSAAASQRKEYFLSFFHDFLQYITSEEHKAPLDFFSWHSYDPSERNYSSAFYVREQLDRYGLQEAESILDEWNPGTQRRGTEADACYIAEMLCRLHSAPVDMLVYYNGSTGGRFSGLYNPLTADIFPAYYAFHAYNELYQLGNAVYTEKDKAIPLLAASDGENGKVLLSNISDTPIQLNLTVAGNWTLTARRVLNGINGLVQAEQNEDLVLPPNKIMLLTYSKA